jgi:hypothetical protein
MACRLLYTPFPWTLMALLLSPAPFAAGFAVEGKKNEKVFSEKPTAVFERPA